MKEYKDLTAGDKFGVTVTFVKEALWSRWGVLFYAWLILGVLDLSAHHYQLAADDGFIALLLLMVALDQVLIRQYKGLTKQMSEVVDEAHDLANDLLPLLEKIERAKTKKPKAKK